MILKNFDKNTLLRIRKILENKNLTRSFSCGILSLALMFSLSKDDVKPSKFKNIIRNFDVTNSNAIKEEDPEPSFYIAVPKRVPEKTKQREVIPEEIIEEETVSFSDLSIAKKQDYIVNTYGVSYEALVLAMTEEVWGVDYTLAREIKARSDFPEIKELFTELTLEKEAYVLERYSLTSDDFALINMVGIRETGGYNYNEGCNFISTLYNRIHCARWINEVEKLYPAGTGYSIMYQINYPGQYPGRYFTEAQQQFRNWISYYSVLDTLVYEKPTHNYCSFRSADVGSGVQLEENGNRYHYEAYDWVDNPTLVTVNDISVYPTAPEEIEMPFGATMIS